MDDSVIWQSSSWEPSFPLKLVPGCHLEFSRLKRNISTEKIFVDFGKFLGSVKVSITACCADNVFMHRLGLLCAANSCSIKAVMASSEERLGLSPCENR